MLKSQPVGLPAAVEFSRSWKEGAAQRSEAMGKLRPPMAGTRGPAAAAEPATLYSSLTAKLMLGEALGGSAARTALTG